MQSNKPSLLYLPPSAHESPRSARQNFGEVRIFARNGLVVMQQPKNGSMKEKVLNVPEARERLSVGAERIQYLKKLAVEHTVVRDEISPLTDFCERLAKAIVEAREQGSYDDPSMVRAKRRSQPVSVTLPDAQCYENNSSKR